MRKCINDMRLGENAFCSPEAIYTSYRLDLFSGSQQENVDYIEVPLGQGTNYFLYPEAEVHPQQTATATIRVERWHYGYLIEIPEVVTFRPSPPEYPMDALIPIINEGHCQRANGLLRRYI